MKRSHGSNTALVRFALLGSVALAIASLTACTTKTKTIASPPASSLESDSTSSDVAAPIGGTDGDASSAAIDTLNDVAIGTDVSAGDSGAAQPDTEPVGDTSPPIAKLSANDPICQEFTTLRDNVSGINKLIAPVQDAALPQDNDTRTDDQRFADGRKAMENLQSTGKSAFDAAATTYERLEKVLPGKAKDIAILRTSTLQLFTGLSKLDPTDFEGFTQLVDDFGNNNGDDSNPAPNVQFNLNEYANGACGIAPFYPV
jgi:hypothetical protein